MKSPIRASIFALAVILAASAACDDSSQPIPVAPTPPPPPTQTLYTLSGVVFETVQNRREPREGVEVYCDSCGSPEGHTFTSTDSNGVYVFTHAKNGSTPLIIHKVGYRVAGPVEVLLDGRGITIATVSGDTRYDIEIIRN